MSNLISNGKVNIGLVLYVTHLYPITGLYGKVRSSSVGITEEDLRALGVLMYPGTSFFWSLFKDEVVQRMRGVILTQYPQLAEIDSSTVSTANFEEWLQIATRVHGEWLKIKPSEWR